MVIASTLTPTVSYDDPGEAIRWLTEVLGFRAAAVYHGPDGTVIFAQLVWRTAIVFVSARAPADNPWAGVGPASIALAAKDPGEVDRLYQRVVAAGVDIVRPVHDAGPRCFPREATSSTCATPRETCGPSELSFPACPRATAECSGGRESRCSSTEPADTFTVLHQSENVTPAP